ncbi:hypothetical protein CAEBREN_25849 [Caenorhabditis brenneri]|uniref:Tyrosine-protein phosphatase domain-containing protein n=1 Tax=Caenorhabditis brenneri TaxID=135651 RepID=G0N3D2_CAEBE|nr:hypothetical protein CAEBREN_25849 [Caenorhabditis brenneri]
MARKSSTRVRKRSRKNYRRNKHRLRPPPPPTRSSKLWIWALILIISTQHVVSAGLLRQEFNGANSTGDGSRMAAARFRRDTNRLDNAITNLGYLARIANGIDLEIGLVDGTINPGEAVAELLHMGSLTVDDIINLNQENIDNVLNALGEKAAEDQAVISVENRLVSLEEVRKMAPKFGDLEKIPGLKKFKEAFEKVKVLVGLKQDLEKLTDSIEKVKGAFVSLKKAVEQPLDQTQIDECKDDMSTVVTRMKRLETSASSLDTAISKLAETKKILSESNLMQTLFDEDKLRKKLNDPIDYNAGINKLTENFKKVNDASKAASTAEKDFGSIQKLLDSRKPSHRQSFKVSSGFPEGPADLRRLYSESVDSRIVKQISDGETVTESLKQGFEPFKKLEESLADVSFKWKSLANSPNEIEKALNRASQLASLSKASETASGVVTELINCENNIKQPPSSDTKELKELDTKMRLLTEISGFSYIKELRETPMDDFDTNGKTSDEQKARVEALLGKWNKDEKLKTFVTNVNSLYTDLSHLKKLVEYASNNTDLKPLTDHFDATFKKPKYEQFLTCLRNIKAVGYPVKELIEYLKQSRQQSSYSDVTSAIHKVIESGKSLESVKTTAADFKNNPSLPPQVALLKSSFDKDSYKETSEKLGMGVQGLIAIKRVREAKLETLLKDVNDILKDAGEKGLSSEQQTSLKQLEEIPKIVTSIENFIKTSAGLQAFRRRRDTGFKDFHQIFMDAQAIQGVSIDMKSLRNAMEELDKVTNQKHATSMAELKNLEALDLDFSKFNFKDVPSSLNALDVFFFEYAIQLSNSPSSSGQQAPSLATADALVETTPVIGGAGITWMTILYVFLALLFIAVFFCLPIYCCCCKPKKPDDVTPLRSRSDSDSLEKDAKEGGKDPKGGKKDDDGSKENKGKKGGDPKPPPSAGATGPTQPPPPPPPPDQGNAAPPPPPPPPPPDGANDQAGAPTDKQAVVVPPPATGPPGPLAVSNEDAIAMIKTCSREIREARKQLVSPKGWADNICKMPEDPKITRDPATLPEMRDDKLFCYENTMARISKCVSNFINCNVFQFGKQKINEKHQFKLVLYEDWPDKKSPRSTIPTLEMLKLAEDYSNVLITSSTGTGRAGTLVAIKYGIILCQRQKVNHPIEIISKVREIRYGAVRTHKQLLFLLLCVTDAIMKARGIKFCKEFHEMEYYNGLPLNVYEAIEMNAETLVAGRNQMKRYVKQKKEEHLQKEGNVVDKDKKSMDVSDEEEVISDLRIVPEDEEKKDDVKDLPASEEVNYKSKKSEKNSKASVASGGSQKKSKKSQKGSEEKSKASAIPGGSQEKSKKKSSKGEDKKSEKKKQVAPTDQKQETKEKSTKKGGENTK